MKNKEKFRSFDETLFYLAGKYRPEITEEFLRLILKYDILVFKSSSCREIPPDVSGCDYLLRKFSTVTKDDRVIGLLTGNGGQWVLVAKACLYFALKVEEYMTDTMDCSLIPKMIMVVLVEKDVYGADKPFYELVWKEENSKREYDGVKYIYVNGEYQKNLLGDYIHDFVCDDAAKMRTGSFKECMELLEINREF
ncbi:MAG: hypothetical protein ACI4WM_00495 [Erysipelotrichaceae bacterium]